jgi:hypothetical protein
MICRILASDFGAGAFESRKQLRRGIDVTTDDTVAGFQARKRRNGRACKCAQPALINAQEGSRSPELICRNHVLNIIIDGKEAIYSAYYLLYLFATRLFDRGILAFDKARCRLKPTSARRPPRAPHRQECEEHAQQGNVRPLSPAR